MACFVTDLSISYYLCKQRTVPKIENSVFLHLDLSHIKVASESNGNI